jgi:hypothetical protein
LAGVNYVAATALAFELIGAENPLSATLYAMLMAACNVAIASMVLSDRHAFGKRTPTAMLTSQSNRARLFFCLDPVSSSFAQKSHDIPTPHDAETGFREI